MNLGIRIFYLLLFFVLTSQGLKCQDQDEVVIPYSWAFSWNAGQIISLPGALQFGVEKRVTDDFVFELQAGYIRDTRYKNSREGYKIEPNFKFFVSKKFSMGPRLLYKNVTFDKSDWFSRNNGSFFEEITYTTLREMYAVFLDMGFHKYFKNSNLGLEFELGLGLGAMEVQFEGIPEDTELEQQAFEPFRQERWYGFPTFRYGLKLKYLIPKRS